MLKDANKTAALLLGALLLGHRQKQGPSICTQ